MSCVSLARGGEYLMEGLVGATKLKAGLRWECRGVEAEGREVEGLSIASLVGALEPTEEKVGGWSVVVGVVVVLVD